ncbi:MAG TPA: DUF4198 domain-containing protein [Pricia sp.]|nr:DUF4198 domain-containing protein [Pricia sp.]
MIRHLFIFMILLAAPITAKAHYLWVETARNGMVGQEQKVKVHYGEYTYGVIEEVNGEAFPAVSLFTLWVIHPDGEKEMLETKAEKNHYSASFVPQKNGTYTLLLNNNEIEVIDYTQYDFGIFKTHYHSTAKVSVGNAEGDTEVQNPSGLAIKELANDGGKVTLQVLYKDSPITEQEAKIFVSDLWSKTLETDEKGQITFELPWDTKYIVETTKKEEVPGTYKGKDYEFIWHCATYCIKE